MSTKALLGCGAVGGPLFVVVFVVEDLTRAGYDPVRYPVSLLAVGELAWQQVANFVLTGLLLLAFAAGLRLAPRPVGGSAWGSLLVAACLVFSRRFAVNGARGWASYSAGSGIAVVVGVVLASAGFNHAEGLVEVAGLVQRFTIVVGWSWLALLAVHLLGS